MSDQQRAAINAQDGEAVIEPSCPGHKGPCNYDNDRLYLDLLGARERLCRAQTHVPRHWKSDLQVALDHIDEAGSALCPTVWSRFDNEADATLFITRLFSAMDARENGHAETPPEADENGRGRDDG